MISNLMDFNKKKLSHSDELIFNEQISMRLYKYIKKIEYVDYKHLDDISSFLFEQTCLWYYKIQ